MTEIDKLKAMSDISTRVSRVLDEVTNAVCSAAETHLPTKHKAEYLAHLGSSLVASLLLNLIDNIAMEKHLRLVIAGLLASDDEPEITGGS